MDKSKLAPPWEILDPPLIKFLLLRQLYGIPTLKIRVNGPIGLLVSQIVSRLTALVFLSSQGPFTQSINDCDDINFLTHSIANNVAVIWMGQEYTHRIKSLCFWLRFVILTTISFHYNAVADLHWQIPFGPPFSQTFFIFMQFVRKFGQTIGWYSSLGLAPPLGNPHFPPKCTNHIYWHWRYSEFMNRFGC